MSEPRGELARYAFGYSDKKPGAAFWIILAGMIIFILYNAITIEVHNEPEAAPIRGDTRGQGGPSNE